VNRILFSGVSVILPDRIVRGSVLVEDGTIVSVSEEAEAAAAETAGSVRAESTGGAGESGSVVDCRGLYLSPGFIDLHNHGRLGRDVMDGTAEALETIARGQAEHGVTGFLAGTSTVPWEKTLETLGFLASFLEKPAVRESAPAGAACLGTYSESNLFSLEKRGAHDPAYLKSSVSKTDTEALIAAGGSSLKIAALSPELPGAPEAIALLKDRGIVVSAAHSNASYAEALAGINAGITLSTHTFNGMRSLHHQEPGILGAVLNDDQVVCELIADGIHLAPAILSLVYRIKGPDRIVLVSDSVAFNGLPGGRHPWENREVLVSDGAVRLEDGRLAGSCLSLDRAVQNMVRLGGAALPEAVRMASLNPAAVLGLEAKKGSVEPGKDADLVLFDGDMTIRKVYIRGLLTYDAAVVY
jgi:N-acetylglucosamine-6-phosphate deacetylase